MFVKSSEWYLAAGFAAGIGWEEIFVIKGTMIEGTPETGEKRVTASAYACREPGYTHGPIRTDEECLMIEFSWYPDKGNGAD